MAAALPALAQGNLDDLSRYQYQRSLQAAFAAPSQSAFAAPVAAVAMVAPPATTPETPVMGKAGDRASWRTSEFNRDWGLQAVNAIQGPHIAHLYAQGDMQKLQTMVTRSSQAIMLYALPVVLFVVIFGEFVIDYQIGRAINFVGEFSRRAQIDPALLAPDAQVADDPDRLGLLRPDDDSNLFYIPSRHSRFASSKKCGDCTRRVRRGARRGFSQG